LWKQRKAEFLLPITAFAGVALLGVLLGTPSWRWIDRRATHPPRLVRGLIVAALPLVFSIFSSVAPVTPVTASGFTGHRSS
jgi:hypothetical protein